MKTLDLSPVKTRLKKDLGDKATRTFYTLALQATEDLMKKVSQDFSCFWAVCEKKAVNHSLWVSFPTLFQGEGGLGEKLFSIYFQLMSKGSVVFIGMDSPHISYKTFYKIRDAFKKRNSDFVLGLAEDGGFYVLAISQRVVLKRSDFISITYSSYQTGALLAKTLEKKGRVEFLDVQTDIDKKEDFKRLKWPSEKDLLPSQKKLKQWIEKTPPLF